MSNQHEIDAAVQRERARIMGGLKELDEAGEEVTLDDITDVIEDEPAPLTYDDLRNLSADQILALPREQVDAALMRPAPPPPVESEESHRPSGVTGPLTMEQVRNMSEAEINRHWEAVQAAMRGSQ